MANKSNSSENLSKPDNTFNAPPRILSSKDLDKVINRQTSSFFDRLFTIVPPQWLGSILAVFLYGLFWSFAGSLTPPTGTPSPTMHSLQDIYNVLAGNRDASGLSANADGNIQEQLKQIAEIAENHDPGYGDDDLAQVLNTAQNAGTYNATNLTPVTVANGVNFGASQVGELLGSSNAQNVSAGAEYPGTVLANLTHGRNTDNAFDVDDYNNGGAPAVGRYETSWTQCNSGNSYCGTSDNRASARDDITRLIWSYPCSGTNCSNMTNETAATYNHATALTNCSNRAPWRLPSKKELMQTYINGAYGNLEPQGTSRTYWSSTTTSPWNFHGQLAWGVPLSGAARISWWEKEQTNPLLLISVRCVRPAV